MTFWSKVKLFSFKKMRLKTSSAKWQPFCLGEDESRIACDNVSVTLCRRSSTVVCEALVTDGWCCMLHKRLFFLLLIYKLLAYVINLEILCVWYCHNKTTSVVDNDTKCLGPVIWLYHRVTAHNVWPVWKAIRYSKADASALLIVSR